MATQAKPAQKKRKIGRPRIERFPCEWRRAHPDLPGRSEAICRLVELGLEVEEIGLR